MATYSHLGGLIDWDYNTPSFFGLTLPRTGGYSYVDIVSGDLGKSIPLDYFTDSASDTKLKYEIRIYHYNPAPDVFPNYTGVAGAKRNGQIILVFDDGTSVLYGGGPVLGTYGGGVWATSVISGNLMAFKPYYPANRMRIYPQYFDSAISGSDLFIIKHIRFKWWRIE